MRKSVLKRLGIVPILLLTLGAWQCNTSNTPYGKAVKVGLDVTDAAHTGADTVDKLRLNGTVTVEEERMVLHYLDTVNNLDISVYGPCVQAAHLSGDTASGYLACGNSLVTSLSDPSLLAQLHVSNPKSQQAVQQIGQAITNLAQTGVAAFQALSQKGK